MISNSSMAIMRRLPQEPDEPDDAYQTFVQWVQTDGRHPRALAKVSGHSTAQISLWRRRWRWEERLGQSEYAIQAEAAVDRVMPLPIEEQVEALGTVEMAEAQCREILKRQLIALKTNPDGAMAALCSAKEAATVARTLFEIERLRAGLSTANVAVASEASYPTIPAEKLREKTTEELQALIELQLLPPEDD